LEKPLVGTLPGTVEKPLLDAVPDAVGDALQDTLPDTPADILPSTVPGTPGNASPDTLPDTPGKPLPDAVADLLADTLADAVPNTLADTLPDDRHETWETSRRGLGNHAYMVWGFPSPGLVSTLACPLRRPPCFLSTDFCPLSADSPLTWFGLRNMGSVPGFSPRAFRFLTFRRARPLPRLDSSFSAHRSSLARQAASVAQLITHRSSFIACPPH